MIEIYLRKSKRVSFVRFIPRISRPKKKPLNISLNIR